VKLYSQNKIIRKVETKSRFSGAVGKHKRSLWYDKTILKPGFGDDSTTIHLLKTYQSICRKLVYFMLYSCTFIKLLKNLRSNLGPTTLKFIMGELVQGTHLLKSSQFSECFPLF
jgi:hypothetical protein